MSPRFLSAAIVIVLAGSSWFAPEIHAQAADESGARAITPAIATSLAQPLRLVEDGQFQPIMPRPVSISGAASRFGARALMTSLYASTATMQLLDVHSTFKALDRGAIEVNPLMSGLVQNRAAFITTKAAMAAVTIYAANKMAKHNKVAAVLTLVAMNSAYAMVVSNNYRIAGR